jgi:hypothetical protein
MKPTPKHKAAIYVEAASPATIERAEKAIVKILSCYSVSHECRLKALETLESICKPQFTITNCVFEVK